MKFPYKVPGFYEQNSKDMSNDLLFILSKKENFLISPIIYTK